MKEECACTSTNGTCEKPAKMSYEQLEQIAHQLSEQSRNLYNKLQEANMGNMFKRLDFLFRIVDLSAKFPEDFVNSCIAEIQELMVLTEEGSDKETSEE